MDNIIKNYEEPLIEPASTKKYFSFLIHKWKVKRLNKKNEKLHKQSHEHNHDHEHDHSQETPQANIPPKNIEVESLALIVDDIVVEIMNVEKSFSEVLQKNPKFILLNKDDHRPHVGWIYQDNQFKPYEDIIGKISPTMRS